MRRQREASEPERNSKNHRNTLRNFLLQGFNKHILWFRCGGKGKHLNLASRHNSAANSLTTNELQGFRQLCPWFRSQQGWNTAACKCASEALLAGGSTKRAAEQPGASEPERNSKNHCNTLRNFLLQGFNKHIPWFRCGGKGKHLNLASRQNQSVNPLTTNALQDFRQLYPRFRSQTGLEGNRLQMCPGGASGRGIPKRANRIAHASEPCGH